MRFVFSRLSPLKCLQILYKGGVGGDLLTLFTSGRVCSLPVGQNIRIWEFFGSDLHLDFCASRSLHLPPTPTASRRAKASEVALSQKVTLQLTPLAVWSSA